MRDALGDGAVIDAPGDAGLTALQAAALHGKSDAFAFLLNQGADVNAAGQDPRRPVSLALQADNLRLFSLAIEAGARVSPAHENFARMMFRAARAFKADSLKRLLDLGGDPEARMREGHTLLHIAARHGSQAAGLLLLDRGVDIDAENLRGLRPLHFAVMENETPMVRFLVALGASTHAVGSSDKQIEHLLRSPALSCAVATDNPEILLKALERLPEPSGQTLDRAIRLARHRKLSQMTEVLQSWWARRQARQALNEEVTGLLQPR